MSNTGVSNEPEIQYVTLPGGAPLVLADCPIEDIVAFAQDEVSRDSMWSRFYILGSIRRNKHSGKESPANVKANSQADLWYLQVFEVVHNLIGFSVHPVILDNFDLGAAATTVEFNLPSLPWSLLQTVDAFFRRVYEVHRSEAIVLLTIDTHQTDENGALTSDAWGMLVPVQENSGGSCSYNQESVMATKEPYVRIVGTIHSHPGMSAFASGIDTHDQESFDGLHITFGWHGGQPTEYHVELQMSGARHRKEIEDICYDAPIPALPEGVDLEAMLAKVSHIPSTTEPWFPFGRRGKSQGTRSHRPKKTEELHLPPGCPDINENTVIAVVTDTKVMTCPVCTEPLDKIWTDQRRCLGCSVFLALPHKSLDQLVAVRQKYLKIATNELMTEYKPRKPIMSWIAPTGPYTVLWDPSDTATNAS